MELYAHKPGMAHPAPRFPARAHRATCCASGCQHIQWPRVRIPFGSWDITKPLDPVKWTYYYLYVLRGRLAAGAAGECGPGQGADRGELRAAAYQPRPADGVPR